MATTCLSMIVKNEAKVIRRALASVIPYIDHWVIHDTGSTDGTQDIIRTVLEGIPGHLKNVPWENFGYNRNLALQEAKGMADYALILDADLELAVEGGDFRGRLTADAYDLRYQGSLDYVNTRLVSNRLDWRYVGVTHEYITADPYVQPCELPGVTLIDHHDGSSRADKFERDIKLLTKSLEEDPADARAMFYLAQSYRDLGQYRDAAHWYGRRADAYGWEEERWYALFQKARCEELGGEPWSEFVISYLRAFEARPTRLEPLYYLTKHYRGNGRPEMGLMFSALWRLGFAYPTDRLFIDRDIYHYRMPYEFGLCCMALGRKYDAMKAFLSMQKADSPAWAVGAADAEIRKIVEGLSTKQLDT